MKKIIQKITDYTSIIVPALVTVFGALGLANAIEIAEGVGIIVMTITGAVTTVASVVYNIVSKVKEEKK